MSAATHTPANVYLALRGLLEAAQEARNETLALADEICETATRAAEADALGNSAERDTHCRALLDQAYELFGGCEPAEHLAALLGYEYIDPHADS